MTNNPLSKKLNWRVSCLFFFFTLSLTACGFHLQGEMQLAPALHRLYLQTNDPYGHLANNLRQFLKASKVQLVSSPASASTILTIIRDESSQELLSVSGTQQTRQYNLRVTVVFEISDPNGIPLVNPQTLTETRAITVQSNQILGSSNEANLFYQQMRRNLAYAIMNRLASKEITQQMTGSYPKPK
ncbi:MAG: hypothetical protein A3F11_06260 [Gammaproteobacteria bacterium RIFCSPHIGHO2_12_FULL_37_14]|nr:MAG: hypothetical protein A3F11_06260 [Gammaproteobacteria bacterium RIFCSPHIGHO2_12_FULL_37_14]